MPCPLCPHCLSLKLSPELEKRQGRGRKVAQPSRMSGTVMGESVLVVKAGKFPVTDLLQPVKLTFKNVMQVKLQTNLTLQLKIVNISLPLTLNALFNMFRRRMGLVCFGRMQGF